MRKEILHGRVLIIVNSKIYTLAAKSRHPLQTPASVISTIRVTLEWDLIAEGQHYYAVVCLSVTDIRKLAQAEVVAGINHEVAKLV